MYKVVLVEDEKFIREGIKSSVDWDKIGCQIAGEASDGEEGLQMVNDLKPDIVLTDVRMESYL